MSNRKHYSYYVYQRVILFVEIMAVLLYAVHETHTYTLLRIKCISA
jgi:hypothetical protein